MADDDIGIFVGAVVGAQLNLPEILVCRAGVVILHIVASLCVAQAESVVVMLDNPHLGQAQVLSR